MKRISTEAISNFLNAFDANYRIDRSKVQHDANLLLWDQKLNAREEDLDIILTCVDEWLDNPIHKHPPTWSQFQLALDARLSPEKRGIPSTAGTPVGASQFYLEHWYGYMVANPGGDMRDPKEVHNFMCFSNMVCSAIPPHDLDDLNRRRSTINNSCLPGTTLQPFREFTTTELSIVYRQAFGDKIADQTTNLLTWMNDWVAGRKEEPPDAEKILRGGLIKDINHDPITRGISNREGALRPQDYEQNMPGGFNPELGF